MLYAYGIWPLYLLRQRGKSVHGERIASEQAMEVNPISRGRAARTRWVRANLPPAEQIKGDGQLE
jgi:hypothetical protein